MPPDSSAVDAAVLALLTSDSTLRTLMPDGIWFDMPSTPNLQRYVIVRQEGHDAQHVMGRTLWEHFLYDVQAFVLHTSGKDGDAQAAADRIHQLLEDAEIRPAGYGPSMLMQRTTRQRNTDDDDVTDTRWHRRGGFYEVYVRHLP